MARHNGVAHGIDQYANGTELLGWADREYGPKSDDIQATGCTLLGQELIDQLGAAVHVSGNWRIILGDCSSPKQRLVLTTSPVNRLGARPYDPLERSLLRYREHVFGADRVDVDPSRRVEGGRRTKQGREMDDARHTVHLDRSEDCRSIRHITRHDSHIVDNVACIVVWIDPNWNRLPPSAQSRSTTGSRARR